MSDRKSRGAESPGGAFQPNPGDKAVPAQPRRSSKPKTEDAQPKKKEEEEEEKGPSKLERETGSGFDASRSLNKKKPDEAKKTDGGEREGGGGGGVGVVGGSGGAGGGVGGDRTGGGRGGSALGKHPFIQVTSPSFSVGTALPGALELPAHSDGQPPAVHVYDTEGKSAKVKDLEAVSETTSEAALVATPSSMTNATSSIVSQQRRHQQQQQQQQQLQQQQKDAHPVFPGVIIVVIASILVAFGLIFVSVRFMVVGFCLVIFGALLLLCGSVYLVHCCLETFRAKQHENFRSMGIRRGTAWLTKPPPSRRDRNPEMQKRSSIAISNASDERVEAIEDLNITDNEAPILPREQDTKRVTKATVAMPTFVAMFKSAKPSTS